MSRFSTIIWNELLPVFLKNMIKYCILWRYVSCIFPTIMPSKLTNFNVDSLIKKQIHIGKEVYLGKDISLSGKIQIWHHCFIGAGSDLASSEIVQIQIWNFCSIARNCCIVASNFHVPDKLTTRTFSGVPLKEIGKDIVLWNDVWIGANSTILYWVTIGNGCIIWAGSIVTKDVPAYSIAVGNPARVIKTRFSPEIIEKLEQSMWWEWEIEKIIRNYDLSFWNKKIWNFE